MPGASTIASAFSIDEKHLAPFPYFLAERCFDAHRESDLLDWFDRDAPWKLVETDFYEQYEFNLLDVETPEPLRDLASEPALNRVRQAMESAFGCRLTDQVKLVAHKLVPGQRIAIHNDYLVGQETHRLTIQVNRGLSDADGGFFLLFNSFDANAVHRILRPVSGSGIGFEISSASYHAVSRVHGGTRYTLVYSFHVQTRADN